MAATKKQKLAPKARKEAVEAAIRERGWDHEQAIRLAQETGWHWRTIYRDRDAVLDTLAQEEQEDLPRRRAAFLADLRTLRKEARTARAYAPATRLLDLEHRVLGLDRVPLPEVDADDPAAPVDTSLEAVLVEVRRLRRQAQAGHSYVAANQLLEREHAIVESIRLRDEAKAAAEQAHLDEAGLVDLVEQAAAGLPEPVKARLRVALGGA